MMCVWCASGYYSTILNNIHFIIDNVGGWYTQYIKTIPRFLNIYNNAADCGPGGYTCTIEIKICRYNVIRCSSK